MWRRDGAGPWINGVVGEDKRHGSLLQGEVLLNFTCNCVQENIRDATSVEPPNSFQNVVNWQVRMSSCNFWMNGIMTIRN